MPFWITPALNVLAVLLSSFISYRISKNTLAAELKKLNTVWQHEKLVQSNAEFDEMVASVSVFLARPTYEFLESAARAVGVYRAKAPSDMIDAVDDLSSSLSTRDVSSISAALACLLKHRRISNR